MSKFWTQETDDAIREYIKTHDERLYNDIIDYAFNANALFMALKMNELKNSLDKQFILDMKTEQFLALPKLDTTKKRLQPFFIAVCKNAIYDRWNYKNAKKNNNCELDQKAYSIKSSESFDTAFFYHVGHVIDERIERMKSVRSGRPPTAAIEYLLRLRELFNNPDTVAYEITYSKAEHKGRKCVSQVIGHRPSRISEEFITSIFDEARRTFV